MTLYRNLLSNTVFVFGCNGAGASLAGAADFAARYCAAEHGAGDGPTGKSYALPVMTPSLGALAASDIEWNVAQFLGYARSQRDSFFQVDRASFSAAVGDERLAALFKNASDNVFLPGQWMSLNKQLHQARLFVECGKGFSASRIEKTLDECTLPWGANIEVVTPAPNPLSEMVRSWARRKGLAWTPFVADGQRFGAFSDQALDAQIAWYCTHAIVYENLGEGSLSRRLLTLRKEGLKVRHFQG